MNEVTFTILEHVGTIKQHNHVIGEDGWNQEVNIVQWNDSAPKFDIRSWDANHERMTRGITLFEDEARTLANVLTDYFLKKEQEQ